MKKIFTFFLAAVMTTATGFAQTTSKPVQNKQRAKTNVPELRATGVSYTVLDYSTLIPTTGVAVTGSLSETANTVIDPWDGIMFGKGYSFTAQAGKTYRITCTFTTSESFNSYAGIYLLENGNFQGSGEDVIADIYKSGNDENQLDVIDYFQATTGTAVRLIVYGYDMIPTDYAIKIQEMDVPSYTALSYPAVSLDVAATGTLSGADVASDFYAKIIHAKGYNFSAQAGKTYRVSCTLYAAKDSDLYGSFHLLTGGALQGNAQDILFSQENRGNTELTLTGYYEAEADGSIRILLSDYYYNVLNYSLRIEEVNCVSYTALNYTTIPADETIKTGQMNGDDNLVAILGNVHMGKGYSFQAEAGKTYQINCSFYSIDGNTSKGFYLLKGTLQGTIEDEIGSLFTPSSVASYNYKATSAGLVRILLCDNGITNSAYSVQIKDVTSEVVEPITLTQLLNNVTRTIDYDAALAFIDNGTTSSLVEQDLDLGFGTQDEASFYSAAYKLTLSSGNNVKIHASKEDDSYLYLYKQESPGVYSLMDSNDDSYGIYGNNDSYLDFTAEASGDYYIVVSDFYSNTPGAYFLTVWNTATEPDNEYSPTPNILITSVSASSNSITVNSNATEIDIFRELMALSFTGTTGSGSVSLVNYPDSWYIDYENKTAVFYPDAPRGYTFDDNTDVITIAINGLTGTKEIQAPQATVYTSNKNIIVCNAEEGSRLLVADITGRIIANTIVESTEMTIPVPNGGLYIVKVGTKATKVVCK